MIINDVNTILMMKTSPLPTGYTLVNYIQSGGTTNDYLQFTGYNIPSTYDCTITIELPSVSGSMALCGTIMAISPNQYWSINKTSAGQFAGVIGSASNIVNSGVNAQANTRYVIRLNNSGITINGTLYPKSVSGQAISYPNCIGMRKGNINDLPCVCRYYLVEDNRDGVDNVYYPCIRDLDGKIGMYNVRISTFFPSTGTFTYG